MEERTFIVIDIETTGIRPETAAITEIGALKVQGEEVLGTYKTLVDPGCPIPGQITAITGITDAMVAGQPPIEAVLPQLAAFCGDLPLIGHNIPFDYAFLKTGAQQLGIPFEKDGLDTLVLARALLPEAGSKSLSNLIEHLGIPRQQAHRAFDDALATYRLYRHFVAGFGDMERHAHLFKPRPLHYRPRKQTPITPRQAAYLNALVKRHGICLEEPVESLDKSRASRLIDRILFEYGKPE